MDERIAFAVIGGSGLYEIPELQDIEIKDIETPFGKPSSQIQLGSMNGVTIAFLARHGINHQFSPTEVNYRANIYALKMLGVNSIISISACGSLKEEFCPGDIVIPDQLYDNTNSRIRSFFGDGIVAHIGVEEPFCNRLSLDLIHSLKSIGGKIIHTGGKLITIEGPRFSTKIESNLYRSWGMSIIGMTASPEAFLAREAEICYSTMAHVTDYDVWHESEEPVTVEMVIKILKENTTFAQKAIQILSQTISQDANCKCRSALDKAIITRHESIPEETLKKMDLLIGKYIKN